MMTTITMDIDINYEKMKDYVFDAIDGFFEDYESFRWIELTPESQEEIIENLLQEFSK